MDDGRKQPDGRLTTTIRRPKHRRASDAGRSRLGDIGRWKRRSRSDRIAPRRRSAWLFGLAALVIAGAIGMALFGLPVRTWFEQEDQLQALEHELGELQTVNDDLENEVERLQTDDGIIEATREELGHIQPGDQRETMQPLPALPRELPDGWPYSQVDSILAIREASIAAAAAAIANSQPLSEEEPDGGWVQATTTLPSAPSSAPPSASASSAATSVAPSTTVAGQLAAGGTSTSVVPTTATP